MKNIIFDVDDTLYNLMEPFEKAHKELMAARTDADCEELFEASRTYSDEAFCMSREGRISEDEEFAYRVQKTYADVGVEVSKEEAKQIRNLIESASGACVTVLRETYPGAVIKIEDTKLLVQNNVKSAEFYKLQDKIKTRECS